LIDGQSILAIIPARGGSKGLPGKNTIDAGGKPLIAWTIEAARASRYLDRIIVSTEDADIAAVAKTWGCDAPFQRPAALATDEASIYKVLLHALDQLEETFDFIILLQPTSPLRTAADIDACLRICSETTAPACVSVCESVKSPHWMYWLDRNNLMKPVLNEEYTSNRRQDIPPAYAVNGAVYVANVDWFCEHKTFIGPKTKAFVMPLEKSIDIDSAWDLAILRAILKHDSAN